MLKITHRKACNKKAELNLLDSMDLLISKGILQLPEFLPDEVLKLWASRVK